MFAQSSEHIFNQSEELSHLPLIGAQTDNCQNVDKVGSNSDIPEKRLLTLVEVIFTYSKNKVYMEKGHVGQLISADGYMTSEVNDCLESKNLLKVDDIRRETPKAGEIVVFNRNGRYVVSLIVKDKKDDKVILFVHPSTEYHESVASCTNCQRTKLERVEARQPMVDTDTPKGPFDKIQIHLVGPLPKSSKGNTHILTVQCNFTKYSVAIPLKNTDSATISLALAEQFISRYGCPRIIHSDQGSNLISQCMKTFCRLFRIKKIQSTAYHPQSLGSLERSHQTLIEYLR